MSNEYAVEYATKMQETATLLRCMADSYPGDITGAISADAFILSEMADLLLSVNWDHKREKFLQSLPKVVITYYDEGGNIIDEITDCQ